MVQYLTTKIVESKQTTTPHYGIRRDGYTKQGGAPTSYMIRLQGEKIWRRVMCWCFSNSGTCFVRIKGQCLVVDELSIPRN